MTETQPKAPNFLVDVISSDNHAGFTTSIPISRNKLVEASYSVVVYLFFFIFWPGQIIDALTQVRYDMLLTWMEFESDLTIYPKWSYKHRYLCTINFKVTQYFRTARP